MAALSVAKILPRSSWQQDAEAPECMSCHTPFEGHISTESNSTFLQAKAIKLQNRLRAKLNTELKFDRCVCRPLLPCQFGLHLSTVEHARWCTAILPFLQAFQSGTSVCVIVPFCLEVSPVKIFSKSCVHLFLSSSSSLCLYLAG